MNMIAHTATAAAHGVATAAIMAIDMGKYKSVACILDQDSGEYRFTTFETSRSELRRLLDKVQPGVVIIEACLSVLQDTATCGTTIPRCTPAPQVPTSSL